MAEAVPAPVEAPVVGTAPVAAAEAEAEREAAAIMLQRLWRRRSGAAAWRALLKDLPRLREAYLDTDALHAGATDNPLYSDRMLAAREKLRDDAVVVSALDAAWESLLPPGRTTLSRRVYYTMSRKLYLAVLIQDAEESGEVDAEVIDANECLTSMDNDWAADAAGKPNLERSDFRRCVFQLADNYTGGISADEYANWILSTFGRIRVSAADKPKGSPHKPAHKAAGAKLSRGASGKGKGSVGASPSAPQREGGGSIAADAFALAAARHQRAKSGEGAFGVADGVGEVWEWVEDTSLLERLRSLSSDAVEREAVAQRTTMWQTAFRAAQLREKQDHQDYVLEASRLLKLAAMRKPPPLVEPPPPAPSPAPAPAPAMEAAPEAAPESAPAPRP